MYRKTSEFAGEGIDYATIDEGSRATSDNKGVVLLSERDLGKTNFHLIDNEGFDSICIDMARSGKEYGVYNDDQVENIERMTTVHEHIATSQFKSLFKQDTTKYQYASCIVNVDI